MDIYLTVPQINLNFHLSILTFANLLQLCQSDSSVALLWSSKFSCIYPAAHALSMGTRALLQLHMRMQLQHAACRCPRPPRARIHGVVGSGACGCC